MKKLERIGGITVLSSDGKRATIEVLDYEQLNQLCERGYVVQKEEHNIFHIKKK